MLSSPIEKPKESDRKRSPVITTSKKEKNVASTKDNIQAESNPPKESQDDNKVQQDDQAADQQAVTGSGATSEPKDNVETEGIFCIPLYL